MFRAKGEAIILAAELGPLVRRLIRVSRRPPLSFRPAGILPPGTLVLPLP
ncbi:hypothetical protein RESH_04049 [Rhodopirellula europaea SH398]|uniref:Uncharacterized protein n=1 Tax=Rhodopirellula europaea SH398 TaxID=1263868 RepID=M5SGM2_9BACT|nr:hypothetical protein RESH_04049 [Rhodopirellula europaea SH398]